MKENKFIKQYLDNNNIEVKNGKFYSKNTRSIKNTVELADDKQFIKVFISANGVLSNLKNSSKLVFEYVFKCLQDSASFNKTEIEVNFKHYTRFCRYSKIKPLCEKSFYLARKQLIELDIIDETEEKGIFFFNLNYFFNGNRITVITEYVRVNSESTSDNIIVLDTVIPIREDNELEGYKQSKRSAFQS
ncbi:hypothetical protein [Methylophilus methylotrophus]|uniref:hypothetical protein n=1 Tax=Methylophilus methylotrophus TaxID=17 RepID=UPI000376CDD4|nr:hypothetical protein [Methylophilus methylotrophus]